MTAEGAFYDFLSGFGIPAYAMTSVPDRAEAEQKMKDFNNKLG